MTVDYGLRKRKPGFQNRVIGNSGGAIAVPDQGWGIVPVRSDGQVTVEVYRDRQLVWSQGGYRTEKAAMLGGREWISRVSGRT